MVIDGGKMQESSTQEPEQAQAEAQVEAQAEPQEQVEAPQELPQQEAQETTTPAPQEQTETPQETQEVPQTINETEEEDEDLELPTYSQFQNSQQPPVDINQLPVDAEGNVDPNVFAQAIYQQAVTAANAQAQQTVAEQLREQKLWSQAEKSYPELANNKDLKAMVHNARLGEMAASLGEKNPTPKQVADRLFKQINTAKASGVEQATNNVKVQQAATLESASTTAPSQDPGIAEAAISGDENARRQYLVGLIDSGQINLN